MSDQQFIGPGAQAPRRLVRRGVSGKASHFYRIDSSHHGDRTEGAASRLTQADGGPIRGSKLGCPLPAISNPLNDCPSVAVQSVSDSFAHAVLGRNRVSETVSSESVREKVDLQSASENVSSRSFEAIIAEWLHKNPRQRAELLALARVLLAHRPTPNRGTLFVSLADETDVPQILVALAWLAHRPGPIVLADADWYQGHLSQLCRKENNPGWAEVCRGWVTAQETLQPLAIPGVWLLPAGNRLAGDASGCRPRPDVERYLQEQVSLLAGQCSQLWWNAGTWPHCQPNDAWRLASRTLVVVRLNQTRWQDLDRFQAMVEGLGRKVDGCVVFGQL